MCVLYVSFGSKVRPGTFGYVAKDSAVLFILRSRLLVYSAGSVVNRVQVDLSGFSVILFCFVQANVCHVVVVCPLQPSSSVNSGCPDLESSILVSSRWACPISS